jgi:dGTPase
MHLTAYACHPDQSRGRRYPEPAAPTRTEFARDRDRIVHSTAFRRLVYKTQVFLNHEGDLFRTRLTHSLEVAQLGRSIARTLKLNEDLVEAIALAHDLGHTPFGHAGQDALNACMTDHGGFEHNLQSLRVVDDLEERYPQYNGLNLSFETREGILKHCSRTNAKHLEAIEPNGVAERFLENSNLRSPSLEAQLCNLADNIAYNAHDIDDGVRSGLLRLDQLSDCRLFETYRLETLRQYPQLTGRRLLFEAIRRMLSAQVYDVIAATTANIEQAQSHTELFSLAHVRHIKPLVAFSESMRLQGKELNDFLLSNLYRHPQVMETTEHAKTIVQALFNAYCNDPAQFQFDEKTATVSLHRAVADYIAGMTDRFAAREHERLTGQKLFMERESNLMTS